MFHLRISVLPSSHYRLCFFCDLKKYKRRRSLVQLGPYNCYAVSLRYYYLRYNSYLLIISHVFSANAKTIPPDFDDMVLGSSEVFHATTFHFLFPGLGVVVLGAGLHQLQCHSACGGEDRERGERVLFDLVLQVLVETTVLHDIPFLGVSL